MRGERESRKCKVTTLSCLMGLIILQFGHFQLVYSLNGVGLLTCLPCGVETSQDRTAPFHPGNSETMTPAFHNSRRRFSCTSSTSPILGSLPWLASLHTLSTVVSNVCCAIPARMHLAFAFCSSTVFERIRACFERSVTSCWQSN